MAGKDPGQALVAALDARGEQQAALRRKNQALEAEAQRLRAEATGHKETKAALAAASTAVSEAEQRAKAAETRVRQLEAELATAATAAAKRPAPGKKDAGKVPASTLRTGESSPVQGFTVVEARPGYYEVQRGISAGTFVSFSASSEELVLSRARDWLIEQAKRKDGGSLAITSGVSTPVAPKKPKDEVEAEEEVEVEA